MGWLIIEQLNSAGNLERFLLDLSELSSVIDEFAKAALGTAS